MRKLPTLVLTALMLSSSILPSFADGDNITRISGNTRVDTSIEASKLVDTNTYVFVAANKFPDALSSYNVVKSLNAKLILVSSPKDLDKLSLSKNNKAFIIGGTDSVSRNIEDVLINRIGDVTRLAGDDRYITNERTLAYSNFKRLGLTSGQNFADALASSGYLSKKNLGLALVHPNKVYKRGNDVDVTFGGELKHPFGHVIAGRDRYETAMMINKEINPEEIAMTDGRNFPDALSALNLIAANKDVGVMLAGRNMFNAKEKDFVNTAKKLYIIGGINNPLTSNQPDAVKPTKPIVQPVKPEETKPSVSKYTELEIVDKIAQGDVSDLTMTDLNKVKNNPVYNRLLNSLGYKITYSGLRLFWADAPYNATKSKEIHDYAIKLINDLNLNNSMSGKEIVEKLGEWQNIDENMNPIDRIRYQLGASNIYEILDNNRANCAGYAALLSNILHILKVPNTIIVGQLSNGGYHGNIYIKDNNSFIQVSIQSITGLVDGTVQRKTIYNGNNKMTISSSGRIYIIKYYEPLSVYENQINALEAIYNR